MAEEKENTEEQAEEEIEKKEKKGLSTLTIILLIAGTLVLNALVVFGVVNFLVSDETADVQSNGNNSQKVTDGGENSHSKSAGEDFFEEEKHRHMMTTGRITTNPKNSISKFVVVELGLEYKLKEDAPEEEYQDDSALMEKLKIKVKSAITTKLGTMTVQDIVTSRGEMDKKFKEVLQPVFNESQIWLRDVYINEFMIQ